MISTSNNTRMNNKFPFNLQGGICFMLIGVLFVLMNGQTIASEPPEILVVTGGHSYDTVAFRKLFSDNQGIKADMIAQPGANRAMAEGEFTRYDAVVFYDMWQDITSDQKQAFVDLTKQGTGLIFLHHSLVSYQKWDEFEQILGGRYIQKGYADDTSQLSGFKHDIEMEASVLNSEHPVTYNMNNFAITDEGYTNIRILPDVKALLKVDHPHCTDTVAWTNKYKNSRIVYVLFGHDSKAFRNEYYQRLLFSAIEWVTGRE